ncbi:MAG: hypothetical protein V3U75_11920 [Methylococcaceae bacterium]
MKEIFLPLLIVGFSQVYASPIELNVIGGAQISSLRGFDQQNNQIYAFDDMSSSEFSSMRGRYNQEFDGHVDFLYESQQLAVEPVGGFSTDKAWSFAGVSIHSPSSDASLFSRTPSLQGPVFVPDSQSDETGLGYRWKTINYSLFLNENFFTEDVNRVEVDYDFSLIARYNNDAAEDFRAGLGFRVRDDQYFQIDISADDIPVGDDYSLERSFTRSYELEQLSKFYPSDNRDKFSVYIGGFNLDTESWLAAKAVIIPVPTVWWLFGIGVLALLKRSNGVVRVPAGN